LHSPAWSQIGQSRGWFTSSSSITPSRAWRTLSLSVRMAMPSCTGVLQAIWSFGMPSTSTWQRRQEPSMESFGCQQ
jgi:hypothetical protein